jgi:hypothetical protein
LETTKPPTFVIGTYHFLPFLHSIQNAISVVMPSALVGTIILTLRGRGVGRAELIRRIEWLRRIIINKGGNVAEFGNIPTGVIVDR